MKTCLSVACLQINAGSEWKINLNKIRAGIDHAIARRADLIALPEHFVGRSASSEFNNMATKVVPQVITEFRRLAAKKRVAFLLGSLLEKSGHERRFYNTSYLISNGGEIVAKYRKIHLFDVHLNRDVVTGESEFIQPGRRVIAGKISGIKVGLAICYDLRFPELFRKLTVSGCRIIFLPSNFTDVTGKAHWEVLVRARAIENQVFIIAPNQVGVHPDTGIRSFGMSLMVDPWGTILRQGTRNKEEILLANLNLSQQAELRSSFPVLKHCRIEL